MDLEERPADLQGNTSEAQFQKLLDDPTFVEYFNTFLTLPVFGKKLLYIIGDDVFEIDPPVKRTCYHVIPRKLKTWVRSRRFPLFLRTDLYLDYLLCTLLMDRTAVSAERAPQSYLVTVDDMHAFHRYVRGTMGERIFLFWLDAERYRIQTKLENRRFVFRELQSKYLRGGSPFELPEVMKWKSLCGGISGLGTKSFTAPIDVTRRLCQSSISVFSGEIFAPLQKLIVSRLRSYWIPKFWFHRKNIKYRYMYKQRGSMVAKHSAIVGVHQENAAKLMEKKRAEVKDVKIDLTSIDEYMEVHKTVSEESVDGEERELEEKRQVMERWQQWFWGSDRKSEDGKRSGAHSQFSEHSSSRSTSTASSPLPSLSPTTALSKTGSSQSGFRETRSSGSNPAMLTPEVIEELTKILAEGDKDTAEEETKKSKSQEKPKIDPTVAPPPTPQTPDEDQIRDTMHLAQPFALVTGKAEKRTLFESLHEDGNKDEYMETYQKCFSPQGVPPLTTLEAIQKAPLPRIIQLGVTPGDVIGVFTKPRTALPDHTMQNQRILQNEKFKSARVLAAVASDQLAGGPFYDYLEKTNNDDGLRRLQFWNETQRYLVPTEILGTSTKYRIAMTIIGTFLGPDSPRMFPMSAASRKVLINLLPIEQGDALLLRASHVAIQDLLSPWLEYVVTDEDHFTSSATNPKKIVKKQIETSDEESDTGDEVTDHEKIKASIKMMRALQLAVNLTTKGYGDDDDNEDEPIQTGGKKLPSLKEVNKQRDADQMRRGSHYYGHIKKDTTEKPAEEDFQSAVKAKPNRPQNFMECLYDPIQLVWFRIFMIEQKADIPLLFWQAVENMKTICKDAKSRQSRANIIVKKYFVNIDVPACENLQCKAEIIRDIPLLDKVTPPMLLSAQACVARTMEEQWFRTYVQTFPEEDDSENLTKYAMRNTLAGVYKMAAHGKTRGLWAMFTSNVTNFQNGINNPASQPDFIAFLKREKIATIEHNTRRHALNPTKRLINNKSVNTEKLVQDLFFWKEVQKFKDMADCATASIKVGNYSADDEKMVQSKARTMLKVFLDSDIPPRVQINISSELAESICSLVNSGIVERGIFHEAMLAIFTTLFHYWKKYSAEVKSGIEVVSDLEASGSPKKDDLKRRRVSYIRGIPYRRVYVMQEDETRWSFSMMHGLRLAIPLKLLARRVTRGDVLPHELSGLPH